MNLKDNQDKANLPEQKMAALHLVIYEQDIPDWSHASKYLRGEERQRVLNDYNRVVDKVAGIFPTPEEMYSPLVEVRSEMFVEEDVPSSLAEEEGVDPRHCVRQRELRADVMYHAAKQVGMDEYNLEKAYLESVPEGIHRETIFDMMVREGGLPLKDLVELGEEFDLV